jgi:cytidylate kinase
MIKILTIDREFGSGARTVAKLVAERLRWELWDERLTDELSAALTCPREEIARREETRDPLYYRLVKDLMRGTYPGPRDNAELQVVDAERIFKATQRLITRLADRGRCVIVGRGSAYILRDRSDAYHAFVYAPTEEKIRRVIGRGKSEAEAAALVAETDARHAAFVKTQFGLDWPFRSVYHLMVNSRVGVDATAQAVLNGIAVLDKTSVCV